MKTYSLWLMGVAVILAGCVEQTPLTEYNRPLTSPGGQFSKLSPVVQNSVRAQAGMAEIDSISKETSGGSTIYVFHFKDVGIYPPLYIASDGSVLTSNLDVAVGVSADAIQASTGFGSNGVKLQDLPVLVLTTIRSQAPTAEVESVEKIGEENQVYYEVFFKHPELHPKLLVADDGTVLQ
ncbi:MAG TPA: hypothetical protein VKV04_18480 [Verrucomicrobiae bacterium]|nr:hypothetical protein [Verrucomicrobiae bacterium]